jgi:hypothetical protein
MGMKCRIVDVCNTRIGRNLLFEGMELMSKKCIVLMALAFFVTGGWVNAGPVLQAPPIGESMTLAAGSGHDFTDLFSEDSCEVISYHGDPALFFAIPDQCPPDQQYAQLFTASQQCQLTTVRIALYNNYAEFSDASGLGVDIIVYEEGTWIGPGSELARINISASEIAYSPAWNEVDFSDSEMEFDGDFYIGYTVVDQTTDNIAILSDAGLIGGLRSFYFCIFWDYMAFGDQDPNFLVEAEVCYNAEYVCGDADASGEVDIDDVVHLIAYIFSGGPAPDPYESGDADCSSSVDIDDVVYLIGYIFSGGNAPCDTDGDEVPDC